MSLGTLFPRRCVLLAGLWACAALCLATPAESAPPEKVDVLIAFKKNPGVADQDLIKKNGGTVKRTFRIVPAISASLPPGAVAALANHKDVAIIEPDGTIQAVDAEFNAVWGVTRIGSEAAYNASARGTGVNVAVIDTGVDHTHAELKTSYKGGYDFVNNDNDPMDDNGHGTHVSGTIAAAKNGVGVVGVAPEVNLYALKVLDASGSGSYSNMIAALDWCVSNAVSIDITNNSYGSSSNPGTIVESAFINAHNAGLLNIAAAGNSGTFSGKQNNVIYPARYASVLAVAATDSSDVRAYFSSTGPDVELAAPGQSIYSTLPGGTYGTYSGTSMACPHAVGTAAVLLQEARSTWGISAATNDYIWDRLKASALDLGATGNDTWYGAGRVQVDNGLLFVLATEPGASPPPPSVSAMHVGLIVYTPTGRKNQDLLVTVPILDEDGNPVSGATVSVAITCSSTGTYSGSGTTNSQGQAVFKISRAPSGTWSTVVTGVTKSGYLWDPNLDTPDSTYTN